MTRSYKRLPETLTRWRCVAFAILMLKCLVDLIFYIG